MNIEEIKNDFSVDYIKHINSNNTKYDINDFGSLITILYGGSPFYLNGEQLEFTNDNKLSDSDVTEMLIDIYEHLLPDLKDGFLNETLTNSRTIPYDATEYFEKIKESKENEASVSEENENEKTDEETLENDVEENNIDYDTSDVELVEPETEVLEKEVEKEPETEISFDNGPAIKSYEEETLALEKEIEELEKKYNDLLNSNTVIPNDNSGNNSLQDEFEALKKKIELTELNPEDNMYPEFESDKARLKELEEQINNLPENKNARLHEEYEELKKKIELTELNPEDNMYPEFESDKARLKELEEQINNLPENKNARLHEEYEELKKKIELTELNPEDNMYPEFESDKARLKELEKLLVNNNNTNLKDLENEINQKKDELGNRKNNIALYYECLEDIKNLYKDVQNGLDTNSEEFVNRVHDIDQKKVTLPEPLKNELSEFLMKIKGNEKKPIPIDKIEKNPKLTWKTFAFLAGGLALGATIGFAVGTTGLIIANAGLAVAKYFVNKKRKEAREKRLNGENEIVSVELPDNKLKAGIEKFKNYIKSEEGLRDISWGLTGGLIGLNVGHIAKNFVGTNNAPTETITQNTQTNNPTVNNTQTVDTNSYSDIRIGNNVGNHNVSVGHDSANWAVNNANPENLIGKYVNSDSVFQRFAVMNPDGTVGQIINTNGMSISDLQAMGIDPSSIAVDVGKNGVSQAWVNITELTKDVANIGRSIH